jgi:hypothetical protein
VPAAREACAATLLDAGLTGAAVQRAVEAARTAAGRRVLVTGRFDPTSAMLQVAHALPLPFVDAYVHSHRWRIVHVGWSLDGGATAPANSDVHVAESNTYRILPAAAPAAHATHAAADSGLPLNPAAALGADAVVHRADDPTAASMVAVPLDGVDVPSAWTALVAAPVSALAVRPIGHLQAAVLAAGAGAADRRLASHAEIVKHSTHVLLFPPVRPDGVPRVCVIALDTTDDMAACVRRQITGGSIAGGGDSVHVVRSAAGGTVPLPQDIMAGASLDDLAAVAQEAIGEKL